MDEEVVPLWNFSDIIDDSSKAKLVDKTKNALKCYNLYFNILFGIDHHQLVSFVIFFAMRLIGLFKGWKMWIKVEKSHR